MRKEMYYGASHLIFQKAQELRNRMTSAEEKIWMHLKGGQLGVKFRRQHPALLYVLDFYCHELRLVIEIDGSIHELERVKRKDQERERNLKQLGLKVMRFENEEVLTNIEKVIEQINDKIGMLRNDPLAADNSVSPLGVGGKAMIFAAGLGTRFKPWTDKHPKALALVNGKSLLQRNIEYLQQFGIREVVVNVHHFAEQVIETVKLNKGWGSKVYISDETEKVLETGGGLLKAKEFLYDDSPFVTINADILTDLDLNKLILFHKENRPLISFAVTDRKTSRHFLFDEHNRLCGWENLKTGEVRWVLPSFSEAAMEFKRKAYSCVVVFQPEIFSLIKQRGKFSLVDVYLDLAKDHLVLGYDHSDDKLVDVGKPESIAIAETLFK